MAQLKVLWLKSARNELRAIRQYYKDTAGVNVGHKITHGLKVYVDILKTHPEIGQEEESLKYLKKGHRYLVKGNYKVIYRNINNAIFIIDVFDTRLNPTKLVKRNT